MFATVQESYLSAFSFDNVFIISIVISNLWLANSYKIQNKFSIFATENKNIVLCIMCIVTCAEDRDNDENRRTEHWIHIWSQFKEQKQNKTKQNKRVNK